MSELKPTSGEWKGGTYRLPIRVYYEDTDLGGMVYHGRYVSFFERVRTESLRDTPADIDALLENPEDQGGSIVYVVRNINITYHRQAKVGEILIGHSKVTKVRAAAIEVKQHITCNGQLVAEAEVLAAIVGAEDGRPKRWPPAVKDAWAMWKQQADEAEEKE